MARVTDTAKREEIEMLRNQISSFEKQLQDEKRRRLVAETKLELYEQGVLPIQNILPIVGQLMMGPRYHLEHVHAGQIGEIIHGRHFQAGETTINNGPELDEIRELLDSIRERQNEVQANATAEDIEEFYSAVASIRAQLDVSRSNRSALHKAIRVIQRIAENTGTSGLAELAKQAASSLFQSVSL